MKKHKVSAKDKWQGHVRGLCHDVWGRGGFEALTQEAWDDWFDSEMRDELTDWEFCALVVLPYCAHWAVADKGSKPKPMEFATAKAVRRRRADNARMEEYNKAMFGMASRVVRTGGVKPVEEPDPEPDVGRLRQPPRDKDKLRVVHAAPGEPDYELDGVSPQRVLVWAEQTTDAFAGRGLFPTVGLLMTLIHQSSLLDWDERTLACRVLAALYYDEDAQEKAAVRRMVDNALRPPKTQEEPKSDKEVDRGKARKTTAVETRAGLAGVVTVFEGKKGGKKYKLWGFHVTAVLRWMGGDAWTFGDARNALKLFGVPDVGDATVKAQLLAGRKGGDCDGRGPAAPLTKDQITILNTMLEDTDAEAATAGDEEGGAGQAGGRAAPQGKAQVSAPAHKEPAADRGRAGAESRRAEGRPPVRPADQPARLRGRAGHPDSGKAGGKGGVENGGTPRTGSTDRRGGKPHVTGHDGRQKARGKVERKLKGGKKK